MSFLLCSLSHGSSSLKLLVQGVLFENGRIATRQLRSGLPSLSGDVGRQVAVASW